MSLPENNVWTLELDEAVMQDPSLDEALRYLNALANGYSPGGIGLTDRDENALLIVSFDTANHLGFFLNVRERDELAERVLVDQSLGDEMVVCVIGGQGDERPRFVFVGYDIASRALRTFFKTGRRDENLTWLPFDETTKVS